MISDCRPVAEVERYQVLHTTYTTATVIFWEKYYLYPFFSLFVHMGLEKTRFPVYANEEKITAHVERVCVLWPRSRSPVVAGLWKRTYITRVAAAACLLSARLGWVGLGLSMVDIPLCYLALVMSKYYFRTSSVDIILYLELYV